MLFIRWISRIGSWPLILLAAAAGCRPQDEITRYKVAQPPEQQMLAAIVLAEDAGWFFKLTADQDIVSALEQPFSDFVRSVRFTTGPRPEPQWKLPPDWKERGPDQLRFATIEIPAAGQVVELAVSTLPKTGGNDQDYVLRNINRWRGQLELPELEASELAANTTTLEVDGLPGALVNFTGESSGLVTAGSLASSLPPVASTNEGSGRAAPELEFRAPDGWKVAPPTSISLAAFTAGAGDNQVEITVSRAGGDVLANVNRWRGQVGLSPIDQEQLAKDLGQIETLGTSGQYVQLVGPSKTIFGVVATTGGTQYFVKLTGNPETAEQEKANFEAFVRSLQLK